MAKQGMKRRSRRSRSTIVFHRFRKSRGRASTERRANPIIAGTVPPEQKVYHTTPHTAQHGGEKPISEAYPVIDNDLARDNVENHIPAADLQDL